MPAQVVNEVKQFKVSDLHKHPSNPRTLKDTAYNTLKESIEANPELLEARPLILSNRTGKNIVIGGNQRLQVVKDLGWLHVPCVLFPDMSEEKEREIMIRDNVSNGDWDWDKLANEWDSAELNYWGLEVPDWEQEQEEYEGQTDQDAAPELEPEAVTQLGDLWLLGDHRLLCGDSTDQATVELLMNGQKTDMVFTDPPYGYSFESNFYKDGNPFGMLKNDDVILDFLPAACAVMAADSAIYLCASHQTAHIWRGLIDQNFVYKNLIVWKKNNWSMGDLKGAFAGQHEVIFFAHKGRVELRGERSRDVWEFDREPPAHHPTQKPVDLVGFAIEKASDSGMIILDLFGGSGSTLIACEKTGRQARLMELDPKYCDVIIKRWQDFSGKQATLEATGETFEEVKHGRAS